MSFGDLPIIGELEGKSRSCGRTKDNADSVCECKPKRGEQKGLDKRLRNWEEWMKRRKEMHARLGDLLQRSPGDLLMNSSEELRRVREEKIALGYTDIPEPDPQRGCPAFWKIPWELRGECGKESSCFAVMPREEKCEVPEIEHVGFSAEMLKEKDVMPRKRNSLELWQKSKYVKEKSKNVKRRLDQIVPHKPHFDELFLKGTALRKCIPSASQTSPPEIAPQPSEVLSETPPPQSAQKPLTLSLSINGFQLTPLREPFGTRKIYVSLEHDLNSEQVTTKSLTLKNEGNVVIRYSWKYSARTHYFEDIAPSNNLETHFCFNKNEELILPDVSFEFAVWFKNDKPGVYREEWQLCTRPNVTPPNSRFLMVLHAVAERGDLNEKILEIEERLNDKIRARLIRETLSSVLARVPYENVNKPVTYYYDKREIFEAVNSDVNRVNDRPEYAYDSDVVRELQKFYKRVKRKSDPKSWNYRIEELRLITRSKQWYIDNVRQYMDLGRKSGQRPSQAEDKGKAAKTGAKDFDGRAAEKPPTLPEELEAIISKLQPPTFKENLEQDKYTQAYLILCAHFDVIGEELAKLEARLGIVNRTRYPKFPKDYEPQLLECSRLKSGSFYEYPAATAVDEEVPADKSVKPQAENLQGIPPEDTKKKYRTYFNIPDTPPPEPEKKGKKGKDKKGKDDKKGKKEKGKKEDKKGKGGKGKAAVKEAPAEKAVVDSDEEVVEELDLLAQSEPTDQEETLPEEEEEKEIGEEDVVEETKPLSEAVRCCYRYNIRIIMQTNLMKALEDIVDMLELQPTPRLPLAVVKEIEDQEYVQRLINLKDLIEDEQNCKAQAKQIIQVYKNFPHKHEARGIFRPSKAALSESESDQISIWSILREDKNYVKMDPKQPISYPEDHYSDWKTETVTSTTNLEESPHLTLINASTSTLDGRLDPNWQDFKDVETQKDYGKGEKSDDLEAYIEKMVSKTSVQDLITIYKSEETQKYLDEYVSDEEYFYGSDSELSINSEGGVTESYEKSEKRSELDKVCSCEGLETCNALKYLSDTEDPEEFPQSESESLI